MSGRRFGDRVIVVGIVEPGTPARQPSETTLKLGAEPIQIIIDKLVHRDQDNERGRGGGAGIRSREGLGTGARGGRDAKDE